MHKGTPKTLRQAIMVGALNEELTLSANQRNSIENAVEDYIRQKMTIVVLKYDGRVIYTAVDELLELIFSKNVEI